ncbi:sulfatase family protein [Carboxylicivirga marina]|uniref:Sulfatase-like hydrolase/transferase n=1 Tax=Carboxylicivirga marina TaxID=2800988 RepID=A0ABS1HF15_9BACT|nr:sulfatase-like hydrolase/transferase [Carboxylicivirga marina]MBK3516215.1 sulfatase-like hydrolase/transferase [Carboxylicivirga marina]
MNNKSTTSIALILLVLITACHSPKEQQKQANVLVIMCDQLNYKALSCYGGPVSTPNIDRIAAEGVRFTRAYSTTPFCSPSRASIVTGLYPHQHGVVHNMGFKQKEGISINDETTGKLLSSKGYSTHQYGKWHVESDSLNYLPYYTDQYDYGYQYRKEMEDLGITLRKEDGQDWMNFYNQFWPVEVTPYMKEKRSYLEKIWSDHTNKDFPIKMGRLRLKPEEWIDDKLTNLTVEQIRDAATQNTPFMITTSFIWPHDPNFLPDPYYSQISPDSMDIPSSKTPELKFEKSWSRRMVKGYGDEGLKEFLRIYYGAVKYLDDRVGRILAELEKQGVLDETLIIFTSDHGDMMGGHGMVWKVNESFYEEQAAIPFMIRYPKLLQAAVSDIPVSLIDMKPTILSATGTKYEQNVAGVNLIPFLTGEKDKSLAPKYSFCERIKPNPQGSREVLEDAKGSFMVRNEQFKLIIYHDGDRYLYDLNNDPHETENIINDSAYKEQILELENALQNWLDETGWKGKKVEYMYKS